MEETSATEVGLRIKEANMFMGACEEVFIVSLRAGNIFGERQSYNISKISS